MNLSDLSPIGENLPWRLGKIAHGKAATAMCSCSSYYGTVAWVFNGGLFISVIKHSTRPKRDLFVKAYLTEALRDPRT